MGQIIVQRNAIGTVSLGLFLRAIGAFVYSALDPAFGPIAIGSMLGGAVVAGLLLRRRRITPHVDPRQLDADDQQPPPLGPRYGSPAAMGAFVYSMKVRLGGSAGAAQRRLRRSFTGTRLTE